MSKKKINRDTEIKNEMEQLKNTFGDLEGRKLEIALKLIEELAFLLAEMKILKVEITKRGSVDEMPQGDYSILRTSPFFKNYLDAAKTYTSIYKQILDLYPKEVAQVKEKEELDDLQKYLKKHST